MIADYFEAHIERLIVGNTIGGTVEQSGGSTGPSAGRLQEDSKFNILNYNARNMADTLTTDLVAPIVKLNKPGAKFRLKFVFDIEDPNATDKLNAIQTGIGMGLDFAKNRVRGLIGERKPLPGEESIGGQQAAPGAAAGAGGDDDGSGGALPGLGQGGQLGAGFHPTKSGHGFWNPQTRTWKPAAAMGKMQAFDREQLEEIQFYAKDGPVIVDRGDGHPIAYMNVELAPRQSKDDPKPEDVSEAATKASRVAHHLNTAEAHRAAADAHLKAVDHLHRAANAHPEVLPIMRSLSGLHRDLAESHTRSANELAGKSPTLHEFNEIPDLFAAEGVPHEPTMRAWELSGHDPKHPDIQAAIDSVGQLPKHHLAATHAAMGLVNSHKLSGPKLAGEIAHAIDDRAGPRSVAR